MAEMCIRDRHYTPARSHRRRIYTLLGGTIGNLENEPQFFRHALVAAAPGDLLLMDFTLSATESTRPEEIKPVSYTHLDVYKRQADGADEPGELRAV